MKTSSKLITSLATTVILIWMLGVMPNDENNQNVYKMARFFAFAYSAVSGYYLGKLFSEALPKEVKKYFIVCLSAIVLLAFGIAALNQALNVIDAENECIRDLVSQGAERKDIQTENGKCYLGG